MRRNLLVWHKIGAGLAALAALGAAPMGAQESADRPVYVLTQHNNNARTGANLQETTLNTSNVAVNTFGKLFTRDVDGYLYAQPLYVQSLPMPGKGLHNVVFLATAHNSVYCFDADDPAEADPLWKVNLGPSVPADEIYTSKWTDMVGEIGITSTPVIDLIAHTIFVETKTKENGTYVQRLHALDIVTGQEKTGSPVEIKATVKGNGDGSENGALAFDPVKQLQRPGLLLSGGVVYLAFGGHADSAPFHGWILGYDAATLKQTCVFNTTPNGSDGAIWQAGMGMASDDAGNLYAMTGNGAFTANTGGQDYGDSLLKLKPAGGTLTVLDYFTPYNQDFLNANDQDLGASGPVLIPNTNLVVGGGKDGWLYVARRDHFGQFQAGSNAQISQSFQITQANIHGSPVYWNSPAGPQIYLMGEVDHLKAFRLVQNAFNPAPASQTDVAAPPGMPGGFASLSANGSLPGTGIVWVCHPYDQNANWVTVPGIIRAYDASDLSHELWNSKMNESRDDVGMFAKFCVPTIANGKVFVSTFGYQLQVYGLLDGILPAIDSVSATSGHIVVHFKKPVQPQTATQVGNYRLDNDAQVLRASLDADGKTVYLATTPLKSAVQYTLSPANIRDRDNPKLALLPATHARVRPGSATVNRTLP